MTRRGDDLRLTTADNQQMARAKLSASAITPGVRWQRRGRFADDPNVDALYAQLSETGEAHLPRESLALLPDVLEKVLQSFEESGEARDAYRETIDRGQLVLDALARRAGENGLSIGIEYSTALRADVIFFAGPLAADEADPWPAIREEAAAEYKKLKRDGRLFYGHYDYGQRGRHRLEGISLDDEIAAEVSRLASRDGYELEGEGVGGVGSYVYLVRNGASSSGRAAVSR